MSELLNPMTLPLRGSRLIEASAGTGKTWTIAALYLRLVLGHGAAGQAFDRPLWPGEILVMTFTKAATRELCERIRGRLMQTAARFRGEAPGGEDEPGKEGKEGTADPFLDGLLAAFPEGPRRQQAAWRLAMAAEAMDDAALAQAATGCVLFARLAPLHKERIVRALRAQGHVVGFLGDGINDAPALRAADVGISVDSAVDIAKESADVILLEKSLLVLDDAVRIRPRHRSRAARRSSRGRRGR